jgi:hypothetical protein
MRHPKKEYPMRKYTVLAVAVAFLLFGLGAVAQTSAGTHPSQTTTTTTTTTNQTTTTGHERSVEGCVVKEASDYFLIPHSGHPIELQATTGEDLSAHEGHRVKIQGMESSMAAGSAAGAGAAGTGGAAGAAANMPAGASQSAGAAGSIKSQTSGAEASTSGAASGTGNDLHRLADRQMSVVKLTHVSETCPVNWNPSVSARTPKR